MACRLLFVELFHISQKFDTGYHRPLSNYAKEKPIKNPLQNPTLRNVLCWKTAAILAVFTFISKTSGFKVKSVSVDKMSSPPPMRNAVLLAIFTEHRAAAKPHPAPMNICVFGSFVLTFSIIVRIISIVMH